MSRERFGIGDLLGFERHGQPAMKRACLVPAEVREHRRADAIVIDLHLVASLCGPAAKETL